MNDKIESAIQSERADIIHRLEEAHRIDQWDHTRQVLRAQIDMIRQGLHERDLVEVPDMIGDVDRFHQKFGQEYIGKPRMLPADLHDFRVKFHAEETNEYADEYPKLVDAVTRQDDRDIMNSLELQLDALVDSVWVLLGTALLQFGSKPFNAAWGRVVTANMAKVLAAEEGSLDSGREAKYDIRKPYDWKAPDHRDLVQDHEHKIFRMPGQLNPGHENDTQMMKG